MQEVKHYPHGRSFVAVWHVPARSGNCHHILRGHVHSGQQPCDYRPRSKGYPLPDDGYLEEHAEARRPHCTPRRDTCRPD